MIQGRVIEVQDGVSDVQGTVSEVQKRVNGVHGRIIEVQGRGSVVMISGFQGSVNNFFKGRGYA